ncbi:MAG TPA: TonB-dependent receptor [Gemmatimonadales bacterium]
MVRDLVLAGVLWALGASAALAQTGAVRGTVVDSTTDAPLPLVRVEIQSGGVGSVTATDDQGRFRVRGIAAGVASVRVTRIGYRPAVLALTVVAGDTVDVAVRLAAVGVPLDPVIVSASRTPESALDAPAAVSVVGRDEIERAVLLAPVEVVRDEPGVDMATKGLIQRTFSVRGEATSNSGALLLLTDHRYAALPSVAFNIPYLIAAGTEDLDRIELVRGPASALYGPGAPRGVLHLVSRSPFESRGGAVALTAGSRSTLGGELRVAERVSQRLALKVSGSYLRGDDWEATDPQEQTLRSEAIAAGADADTLRIGRRDFDLARASGEARLDWRPDGRTEVVTTLGAAQALAAVDMTPFGGIQGRDWRYSFGQIRLSRDRLSANVFYNWSDAGGSYVLRTGDPIVDHSRVLVGQVQHGTTAGPVRLLYGADVRWTSPRTEGTISGVNEDRDNTTEIGGYGHASWAVTPRLEAIGALRVDHHTALNDLAFSPRLALVFKPASSQALRASYNRAFTSPDANDLFLDIVAGEIALPGGFGYAIRGTGVPKDGFHFRRDCGGRLCMRSPFAIAAGALPGQYLPADATVLWPAVVAYAESQGIDLSAIPAPDASQVGTRIARLDITAPVPDFVDVNPADITDVEGEGRTITNALELGYKGFFAGRVAVTADLWMARVSDVAGSQYIATPSVFYDRASLEAYLAGYMSAAEAAELAEIIARIPAGTISPEETPHYTDLLAVSPRGGAYTLWGADLGLDVALTRAVSIGGTYSWVSADTIPNVEILGVVYLNAPRDKASARVELRSESLGVTAGLRGRYVRSFPVKNGVYQGHVDAYALVDVALGLAIPGWRAATLTVSVQNLFDDRHVEFVGAPVLGRYAVTRLRVGW